MDDNAVIDLEPVVHIVDQASLYDRKYALIEDGAIIFIFATLYCALGDVVLVAADQIARPSESRDPNPVFQSRVPPHVIGVKMRAHHKINVVGGKTNAGEALEIRRLQAVKKLVCWKALVVPNAAIDQDRMSARAQHPAMIAVDHVTA